MNHGEIITGIHPIHNWEYADAVTREAATGLVSTDLHKMAWQQDDNSFWVLTDIAPVTWTKLTGATGEGVGGTGTVGGFEYVSYNEDETETSSADTVNYVQKLSAGLTADGTSTYFVQWYAEYRATSSGVDIEIKAEFDDTTVLGHLQAERNNAVYEMFYGFAEITPSAGAHTIDIDWRPIAATTCFCQRARVLILKELPAS